MSDTLLWRLRRRGHELVALVRFERGGFRLLLEMDGDVYFEHWFATETELQAWAAEKRADLVKEQWQVVAGDGVRRTS